MSGATPRALPRTLSGVREALFDALDRLRAGDMKVDEARSTAELCKGIIASAAIQLDFEQAYAKKQIGKDLLRVELVPPNEKDRRA